MKNNTEINKKQLLDINIFNKALKIIKSKPKKPKENLFSRQIIRYDIAVNTYDVLGCAKAINELKIYFDGTLDIKKERKKLGYNVREDMFLKSLRNIAQLITYHKNQKREYHWENATDLLHSINILAKIFNFSMHGHIFSEWPKPIQN